MSVKPNSTSIIHIKTREIQIESSLQGSRQKIDICDLDCKILKREGNIFSCRIPNINEIKTCDIKLAIDDEKIIKKDAFSYVDKPKIFLVEPNVTATNIILPFKIYGKNLHYLSDNVTLITVYKDSVKKSKCETATSDGSYIKCRNSKLSVKDGSIAKIYLNEPEMNVSMKDELDIFYYNIPKFKKPQKIGNLVTFALSESDIHHMYKDEISMKIDGVECPKEKIFVTRTQIVCDKYYNSSISTVTLIFGDSKQIFTLGEDKVVYKQAAIIITVTVSTVFCIIVTIFSVLFFKRKNRQKAKKTNPKDEEKFSKTPEDEYIGKFLSKILYINLICKLFSPDEEMASTLQKCGTETRPLLQQTKPQYEILKNSNLLLSEKDLIFLDILGQGHFGTVRKGILLKNGEEIQVAVKTLTEMEEEVLPDNLREKKTSDFLEEAVRMKNFHHQNVLSLIGVTLNSLPNLILPFMAKGDLLTYLRDPINDLCVKNILDFAIGIADGMTYLSSIKFVHRDLAARNCMLDEDLTIKVSDFGLSREVCAYTAYYSQQKKALPVRWMAPESLQKGKFTLESDVWSFGVVVWELFTRGAIPYETVQNWDIILFLQNKRRLNKPQYCPNNIWNVVMACWNELPTDRPRFDYLKLKLEKSLKELQNQEAPTSTDYPNLYAPYGYSSWKMFESRMSQEELSDAYLC